MGAVTDFFSAFFKVFLSLALLLWVIYIIVWALKKYFTPRRITKLKFKLFRRSFDEEIVEWCVSLAMNNYDEVGVRKLLLLSGYPESKVEEVLYTFVEVKNNLVKGGKIQNDGLEKDNGKVKLPNV